MMRWPGVFSPGSETKQVTLMFDLTASILAAAGAKPSRKLDGEDLLAEWQGKRPAKPRTVFWRYRRLENTRKAVRHGDWKLVDDNGKQELHHLAGDPYEEHDQLAAQPKIAADLREKLAAWEKDVRAPRLKDFYSRQASSR
jgi:N-acetylgalactosamine-6-sulfatase